MHVHLDLNHNDLDALLRHCKAFVPTLEMRERMQSIRDALETLARALEDAEE
ncbi:hypothetical protein ACIQSO_06550 [Pseudomonas putida]|uniref:hypothetical protein n=1 Tax=Pseudomonas putida TaxID=303 RepID=UPI00383B20CB